MEVGLFGNVERAGVVGLELGGDGVLGLVQFLEQVGLCFADVSWKTLMSTFARAEEIGREKSNTHGDGEVVTAGELCNLADAAEGGAHDDGLVAVLLVVVVDALHALDARVVLGAVLLLGRGLVPVEDAADKRRDEEDARLGGSDGLHLREEQRQVAVDAVLRLQHVRGLDAFVGRRDLDEHAVFGNADFFVELLSFFRARQCMGVSPDGSGGQGENKRGNVRR